MAQLATNKTSLQELYVMGRKASAVYNLCREFNLPSVISVQIRSLKEAITCLIEAVEHEDREDAQGAINDIKRFYHNALVVCDERKDLDLHWLALLLSKIEG
ncbi:hypothetical protein Ares1_0103 [Vibrio phage Ares1]|nr:hypothetical protein Ares1_0103 [Vibrio phage Ares1]